MQSRKSRGFSLIELLVVVAIVGILVAMAIYNYRNAVTRTRQKRTMADMRNVAVAWEQRAIDSKSYAAAGFNYPTVNIPYGTLQSMLSPTYARHLPQVDAWGRPFQFATDADGDVYAIRSSGRDGIFETSYPDATTNDPDCDIVYSGGSFVVYPETVQRD